MNLSERVVEEVMEEISETKHKIWTLEIKIFMTILLIKIKMILYKIPKKMRMSSNSDKMMNCMMMIIISMEVQVEKPHT